MLQMRKWKRTFETWLQKISVEFFCDSFRNVVYSWQKCVQLFGDYVGKINTVDERTYPSELFLNFTHFGIPIQSEVEALLFNRAIKTPESISNKTGIICMNTTFRHIYITIVAIEK